MPVGPLPADHLYLKVFAVEFHFFGQCAFGAQPHHFLLAVGRQSPSLRLRHRQGIDFARTQPLEFDLTPRIRAFPNLWWAHS